MRFAGYAALFGKRDAGRDLVLPGAFAKTLAERRDPLPLYWQHTRHALPMLKRLTDAVVVAARQGLEPAH